MAKNQNLQDNQQYSDLVLESQIQETFTESARRNGQAMKKVHITLQGKGGIGKSFVSTIIARRFNLEYLLIVPRGIRK